MRILLTVLLALAATAAHAQTDTIRKFAQSAQKWSGADPKRQEDTARYVKIRGKRLTNFIGAGAAWYSDLYDIVGVDRKYFGSDGKLKSLPEMHTEDCGGYINAVATIFHEMGHAEWDHFIEEKGGNAEDKKFYEVVTATAASLPEAPGFCTACDRSSWMMAIASVASWSAPATSPAPSILRIEMKIMMIAPSAASPSTVARSASSTVVPDRIARPRGKRMVNPPRLRSSPASARARRAAPPRRRAPCCWPARSCGARSW